MSRFASYAFADRDVIALRERQLMFSDRSRVPTATVAAGRRDAILPCRSSPPAPGGANFSRVFERLMAKMEIEE